MSLGHGWHGMARLRQASFTGLAAMHTQPSTGPPGRKSKLSSFFWRHTSSLCIALLILSQRHSVSCHQLCCHGAMSWVSWVFASWMGAGRPWKLSLWFPPCGGMARRAARARRVARRRGLESGGLLGLGATARRVASCEICAGATPPCSTSSRPHERARHALNFASAPARNCARCACVQRGSSDLTGAPFSFHNSPREAAARP